MKRFECQLQNSFDAAKTKMDESSEDFYNRIAVRLSEYGHCDRPRLRYHVSLSSEAWSLGMSMGTRCAFALRWDVVGKHPQNVGMVDYAEDKARALEMMQHIAKGKLGALVSLKARAAGMRDWQGRTSASRERDLGKASVRFTLLFHQSTLSRHAQQAPIPSHPFLFPSSTVPYQADIINQRILLHYQAA